MERKNERNLNDLKQLLNDALSLAAGGIHANAACPSVTSEELGKLIRATAHLNAARGLLWEVSDFIVFDGAAGPLTD